MRDRSVCSGDAEAHQPPCPPPGAPAVPWVPAGRGGPQVFLLPLSTPPRCLPHPAWGALLCSAPGPRAGASPSHLSTCVRPGSPTTGGRRGMLGSQEHCRPSILPEPRGARPPDPSGSKFQSLLQAPTPAPWPCARPRVSPPAELLPDGWWLLGSGRLHVRLQKERHGDPGRPASPPAVQTQGRAGLGGPPGMWGCPGAWAASLSSLDSLLPGTPGQPVTSGLSPSVAFRRWPEGWHGRLSREKLGEAGLGLGVRWALGGLGPGSPWWHL